MQLAVQEALGKNCFLPASWPSCRRPKQDQTEANLPSASLPSPTSLFALVH